MHNEPSTRRRPRRALQEQIGVLSEHLTDVHSRCEGLDVLDLSLGDNVEHVLRPLLDEWHEAACSEDHISMPLQGCMSSSCLKVILTMAKRSVWTAERKMIRKRRNSNG